MIDNPSPPPITVIGPWVSRDTFILQTSSMTRPQAQTTSRPVGSFILLIWTKKDAGQGENWSLIIVANAGNKCSLRETVQPPEISTTSAEQRSLSTASSVLPFTGAWGFLYQHKSGGELFQLAWSSANTTNKSNLSRAQWTYILVRICKYLCLQDMA